MGYGEIGKAISTCYSSKATGKFDVLVKEVDKDDFTKGMKLVHICIPFSNEFIGHVTEMAFKYKPDHIVIHSTVMVGTTEAIGEILDCDVFHSPVRGVHPNLYSGLLAFEKWIGYEEKSYEHTGWLGGHFRKLGMIPVFKKGTRTTELAKLLSTTYYGAIIAFHDYANNICKEECLDFDDVMTKWNNSYNSGYKKLKMGNVVRPVLYAPEGRIGGHCVIPNAMLLKAQYGSHSALQSILDLG